MKFAVASILLSTIAVSSALELTPANWDAETSGKVVFIKYFAPWCGHCKALKPDWDKLMEKFAGSTTQLVADVDCDAEGEPLCQDLQGYPTLKWGEPDNLNEYEGGRDYESLEAFVMESLKPTCSPTNIDLCDDATKTKIQQFQALADDDLTALIEADEKKLADAEEAFMAEVEKLQETYNNLAATKDETFFNIKSSGLSLMKSIKAANSKKTTTTTNAKEEL